MRDIVDSEQLRQFSKDTVVYILSENAFISGWQERTLGLLGTSNVVVNTSQ